MMARVSIHNYLACKDSDPDTNHGFEERIYLNMAVRPLGQHLAEIFDAADAALLRSAYMCQHRVGEYRDMVYICSPTELAVEAINRWVLKMKIHLNTMRDGREPSPLPPIYLAARPSFDRDKLMVLLMKAPKNAFL